MCATETKLKAHPVEEKEVLKILTQVNVTRRKCEIVCIAFPNGPGLIIVRFMLFCECVCCVINHDIDFYRSWSRQTLMRRRRSIRESR